MSFRVTGLPLAPFQALFGLSDEDLAGRGVIRRRVDVKPGAPCRITLRDAEPGESVLLLNHEHQGAATPYRACHAIYVREAATETRVLMDELPEVFHGRTLAVRAFDDAGMMVAADICQGSEARPVIERLLADPRAAYLHAHNAARGCYAARIDR